MDREYDAWWRKQLLAAILSGLAGYIKASSSPSPQSRRLRYILLVLPPLTQIVARLSIRRTAGPEGQPGGTINCLPMVLLVAGAVAYVLYPFFSSRKRRR